MSTDANAMQYVVEEAFRRVGSISTNVPMRTTLTELQLVVERLTFSELYLREQQDDAGTMAEIELFFRNAVSSGMVQFIRWVAANNALSALGGERGRIFLDHCVSAYGKIQEVEVVTAIDLSEIDRAALTTRLRAVHPEPTRILFSTSPAIVAGLVVNIGTTVIDKSLRTHLATTIPRSAKTNSLVSVGVNNE